MQNYKHMIQTKGDSMRNSPVSRWDVDSMKSSALICYPIDLLNVYMIVRDTKYP